MWANVITVHILILHGLMFNLCCGPLQINGKMRGTAEVAVGVSQEEAVAAALELPNVQKFTAGKEVKKVIYVPGKILNLIVPNK